MQRRFTRVVSALLTALICASGAQAQFRPANGPRVDGRPPAITVEFEALASQATRAGAAVTVQDMRGFGNEWSGSAQLLWRPAVAGPGRMRQASPTLSLVFEVSSPGTFGLVVHHTVAPDYGVVRLGLDGQTLNDVNGYGPGVARQSADLGTLTLRAGRHVLSVTLVGKDPASAGFLVGLDRLDLRSAVAPVLDMPMRELRNSTLDVWDGLLRVDNMRLFGSEATVDTQRADLRWWFRWSTHAAGATAAVLQAIQAEEPPIGGSQETWMQPPGMYARLVVPEGVPPAGVQRDVRVDITSFLRPPPVRRRSSPQPMRAIPAEWLDGNRPRIYVRLVPIDDQGNAVGPPSRSVTLTLGAPPQDPVTFTAAGANYPEISFFAASPGQLETWLSWCHGVAVRNIVLPATGQLIAAKGASTNLCASSGGGIGDQLMGLGEAVVGAVKGGLDFVHDAWESAKAAVVSVAASALGASIGCPSWCNSALEIGLTIAMTSVGLPPTIPDFDAVISQGKDYLVQQIAAEIAKASPVPLTDVVVEYAAREALDAFVAAAKGGAGSASGWGADPKYQYRPLVFVVRATGRSQPRTAQVTARVYQKAGTHFAPVDVVVPSLAFNETVHVPVVMTPSVSPHLWQQLYPSPTERGSSKCGQQPPLGSAYPGSEKAKAEDAAQKAYWACVQAADAAYATKAQAAKVALDGWRAKYGSGAVSFGLEARRGTQVWGMGQTYCSAPLAGCALPTP